MAFVIAALKAARAKNAGIVGLARLTCVRAFTALEDMAQYGPCAFSSSSENHASGTITEEEKYHMAFEFRRWMRGTSVWRGWGWEKNQI